MCKRLIRATALSFLVMIVPALGNIQILKAPNLWILMLLGLLASLLQPEYNPFTITAKPKDGGTGAQIIWSVYLTQLFAILEATYLRYPDSVRWDWVSTVALGLAIVGLLFRTWSVWTLGAFFTMHIEVQEDHKIIRTGPYRYIRHPSYLGAFVLHLSHFMIYLRDAADYSFVKPLIDQFAKDLPAVYVKAPVCRPGWLIEIEATAGRAIG